MKRNQFQIRLIAVITALFLIGTLGGCLPKPPAEAEDEVVKLQTGLKDLQAKNVALEKRVSTLETESVDQSNELYQLGLAANWEQLLANFDQRMADYESRLKGPNAVGYQYGNLGDDVFPMLNVMITGRNISASKIWPRINRLAKYVAASEKIGTNEQDSESHKALARLRKKLKGF